MAQTIHFVTVEAASRDDEPRNETQILWLELEVPVASPWCQRKLVCAGPEVYPDIKYAPGRKSFVLDGATLMTLHKELRTKLLAKLKAAGHAQDPPESVSLEIEGFLTPSGGANPRVEIPGKSLLNIEFQDQNQ
jgi:hypothetical protein